MLITRNDSHTTSKQLGSLGISEIEIPTNELIWSGIGEYHANIMRGSNRDLDAFYVVRGEGKIKFHQRPIHTTNPRYFISDLPKGKYLLEYTVICTNFEDVSQRYLLSFEGTEDEIELQKNTKKYSKEYGRKIPNLQE